MNHFSREVLTHGIVRNASVIDGNGDDCRAVSISVRRQGTTSRCRLGSCNPHSGAQINRRVA